MSQPSHFRASATFVLQTCLMGGAVALGSAASAQTIGSLPAVERAYTEPGRLPIAPEAARVPGLHLLAGQQKEPERKEITVKKAADAKRANIPALLKAYFDSTNPTSIIIGEKDDLKNARKNLQDGLREVLLTAEKEARSAAKMKDAEGFQRAIRTLYGVNMFIAEFATDKEFDKNGDKLRYEPTFKVSRALADDLVDLANPKEFRGEYPAILAALPSAESIPHEWIGVIKANWGARQSALNALGKISPNPNAAVRIIIANLEDEAIPRVRARLRQLAERAGDAELQAKLRSAADLDPRHVAAWALIDLAHYAHLLPTQERLQTIWRVTEAANIGLKLPDADEFVRGYCLLALTKAAQSLGEYINRFNKQEDQKKRDEIDLNEDFLAIFAKYQAVNGKLLDSVADYGQEKIQVTALEAIEGILIARSSLVRYFRQVPANQTIDSKKLLIANVKKDPLQEIIDDHGKKIAVLLADPLDRRLRRKAMAVLDLMGEDLRLFNRGSESVLEAISAALRNKKEDIFLRWSGVEAIEKLLFRPSDFTPQFNDDMSDKEKLHEEERVASNKETGKVLLQKLLAHQVDVMLIELLMNADAHRSTTLENALASSYPDPDLCKAAASALNALGEMATVVGSDADKKALGSKYAKLFNYVYLSPGSETEYGPPNRYDVETRTAIMKGLVGIGGAYIVDALHAATMALEQDPEPRIRRAAAQALGHFGPAGEKAIPALTRVLASEDEDSEVILNASATLITISSARK